ncbi:zinc finger MYM-type protein 1-like [Acyrthosiphon pisum]|uniref:TTF-type domain-containing protein n=1 Tax=Acyrthosiphon pisum TaxID=7029 RepID=A0A8R2F780_ACYPI|nr:zinc finger MYM-type protein 1-like [Acyrthosiphon pisum]|eukprot:XP_008181084.1 PREDICTED: zinc finger MYM-type protein 1-like [Acyrthosiphon pisum]
MIVESWDISWVLFIGEENSGSLVHSEIVFPRSSESSGGRVSSISTSAVISRMLVALESDNETPIEDSVVHKNEKPSDDCNITFNDNLSVTDNETKRNTSNFELNNLDLGTIISGPVQPILKKYPTTKFGDQNRAFSASYFAKFDWLEYSIINDAIYCFACRNFSTACSEDSFIQGFRNWKKLYGSRGSGKNKQTKLEAHGSTKFHNTCMTKWTAYKATKLSGSVHTQLSNAHKQQIVDNRNYIKTITDIILYLARQGLAFRGHDERLCSNNQGNFKEACKLFAKHNAQFANYHNNTINYGSWLIQNDIANICAQHVKNSIIDEVKSFSSSTCERSFSTMRRVKTWLRTTMAEDRFSSLALLNIERDLSNKIDSEVIVNKFAEQDRKIVLK